MEPDILRYCVVGPPAFINHIFNHFILFLFTITFDIGNRVTLFERDGLTNGPFSPIFLSLKYSVISAFNKTYRLQRGNG